MTASRYLSRLPSRDSLLTIAAGGLAGPRRDTEIGDRLVEAGLGSGGVAGHAGLLGVRASLADPLVRGLDVVGGEVGVEIAQHGLAGGCILGECRRSEQRADEGRSDCVLLHDHLTPSVVCVLSGRV